LLSRCDFRTKMNMFAETTNELSIKPTTISCASTGQTLYYKQSMDCDAQVTGPDDQFLDDL